jgi:serine protease Do
MKKLFLFLVLMLAGCSTEKYVKLSEDSSIVSTMITVPTIVTTYTLTLTEKGIEVNRSTATAKILGSGVMVSPNGHILTCAHLFDNGTIQAINVTMQNGIVLPAKLVYQDQDKDLALLKVEGRYEYAKLTSQPLKIGQEVLVVGNPRGLDFSVSHGIISQLGRDFEGYKFTQIDAPINPGNSGGPLFNLKGELIGINAMIIKDSDGLGFAISPETIMQFLDVIKGV